MMESPIAITSPSLSPDVSGQIPVTAAPPKQSKGLACIFCQQRKVKCDRKNPCNTCTKARVQCSYRARRTPRRKEVRATEVSLRARLGRLEDLLKTAVARNEILEGDSAEPDSQDASPQVEDQGSADMLSSKFENNMSLEEWLGGSDQEPPGNEKVHSKAFFEGRMFTERGKSRYIENKLWSKIFDEVKDVQEILDEETSDESEDEEPMAHHRHESIADDLIFGLCEAKGSLSALHPSPANMQVLWVAFAENVNPLNKIVHIPSTQPIVRDAMADPNSVSKADTAFLFAVWLGAVSSLDDQGCQSLLGEPRSVLLRRYKIATQKALINAGYLKSSNLNCLRGFVLYLLAVRPYYDSKTFWATLGLAVRVSQRLGIHKDGAQFNLPPFETEMRRRLWWQIIHLDVRASEVAGAGITTVALGDIKRPLNVNDEDMWPNMPNAPIEHAGETEMCFVLLRCSIGRYFRYLFRPVASTAGAGTELEYSHSEKTIEELMKEFEVFIQDNFLARADPLVPIQFFTAAVARAIMCSWKVINALRRSAEKPYNMSREDRDMLFEESLKGIEYDNLGHTTKATQRFMWHIASHFQWHSLITLLHELRTRTTGDLVERAWIQVSETYKNRPELMKTKNPLHAAIARLTLAAWRIREDHYTRVNKAHIPVPDYISTIRRRLTAQEGSRGSLSSSRNLISADIGSMSNFANMVSAYKPDSISTPSSITASTISTSHTPFVAGKTPNFNLPSFQSNTADTTGFTNTAFPEETEWFNTNPLSPTSAQATPTTTSGVGAGTFAPGGVSVSGDLAASTDNINTGSFGAASALDASALDAGAFGGVDPSIMDWNMWGNLLENYELPLDGREDFTIPTATGGTVAGFNDDNTMGGFGWK